MAAFGFAFPRVMADLGDALGNPNMAAMYYERVYRADPGAGNLYMVLDRYISAENHGKVITFAEKFLADDGYLGIIQKVNAAGEQAAAGSKLRLVSYANEDSRIKTAYIIALARTGMIFKVVDLLQGWESTADTRQPNHAFIAGFLELPSEETKGCLVRYVDALESSGGDEGLYSIDFLMIAYGLLGDSAAAANYARLFDEL